MIARYFRFYYLIVFGMFLNTVFLFSQEEIVTNEDFIFSWQKANGDQYEIPVKNNLDLKIEKQKISRVLMQILLKSIIKSRDFQAFNPLQITLIPDKKNNIVILDFTKLDNSGEKQKLTYYFAFDTYGNVFDQLDL